MLDREVLVELRLDPTVVEVEDMIVHRFRLNLGLGILEVSFHLIASLKQTENVITEDIEDSVLTLVSKCTQ